MARRTRHILVDTPGPLLRVVVHAADIQDRAGANVLPTYPEGRLPRLRLIRADGGYAGKLIGWVEQTYGWMLAILERTDHEPGFEVVPRRWAVERTFGWLGRSRRLSKDDEERVEISQTSAYLAMIHLMLRRLTR